jgi:hypothetical protein
VQAPRDEYAKGVNYLVDQSGNEEMSKIAYLVFAYKNPQLLKRAIKRLSTEHCAFLVHIDQKIDIGSSLASALTAFSLPISAWSYIGGNSPAWTQSSYSFARHLADLSDMTISCFLTEASIA